MSSRVHTDEYKVREHRVTLVTVAGVLISEFFNSLGCAFSIVAVSTGRFWQGRAQSLVSNFSMYSAHPQASGYFILGEAVSSRFLGVAIANIGKRLPSTIKVRFKLHSSLCVAELR